jgi:hypothetical protein
VEPAIPATTSPATVRSQAVPSVPESDPGISITRLRMGCMEIRNKQGWLSDRLAPYEQEYWSVLEPAIPATTSPATVRSQAVPSVPESDPGTSITRLRIVFRGDKNKKVGFK